MNAIACLRNTVSLFAAVWLFAPTSFAGSTGQLPPEMGTKQRVDDGVHNQLEVE